jgi:hypothetical protein
MMAARIRALLAKDFGTLVPNDRLAAPSPIDSDTAITPMW